MQFTARQGRLNISLRVFRQGRDLQVLCGGGASHIGAVALAAPGGGHAPHPDAPYQADQTAQPGQVETRLLVLPGHREDALAQRMAQSLAEALHCAVCVSTGIHYDNITRAEIQQIGQMAQDLTQRCIAALAKDSE
jgi:gallate decarboxylase subunit D